ncbi:DUF2062 domain-containing protein [Geoalkalibacter subterraneus]|uniref:DUF2062 domain-containing protein n=1 Tax=Geoalkalibacter subterraneus TaxID=483547 RepID=A0A0B5FG11_9BACT|nr:DUF2062 domain-containing protein [Geoalkalibacter subterraneus]AJF06268.1 hypothetical protein GSUB_06440 [Geoalkalibacter subterraneus]
MWQRWSLIRQFKLNLIRLVRLRATPDEIAKGIALGVFIGMTPTFGIQMFIALLLAFLLRENKIAALVGVWVTNPVTAPVIYTLEYEIGRLLLGLERSGIPRELSSEALIGLGWDVLWPICVGSVILGTLCSSLAYALTLRLIPIVKSWRIPRWPRRRLKRHLHRNRQ